MEKRKLDHYWIYCTTTLSGGLEYTYGKYGLASLSLTKIQSYLSIEEVIQAILDAKSVYKGILFYTHGFMADTPYFEETIGGQFQTKVLDQVESKYDLIISLKWSSHLFYPYAIPLAMSKGKSLFDHVYRIIVELQLHNNSISVSFMNHSMGNRVFTAMMATYLEGGSSYSLAQVHMFAADVEDDIFFNTLNNLPARCQEVIIYYHQNDKTLMMANKLNKYPRLGIYGHQKRDLLPSNILQIDTTDFHDNEGIVPQLTLHRYFYASAKTRSIFINKLINKQ